METTEAIRAYSKEFGDLSFTQAIEHRLRQGWDKDKCQKAMNGIFSRVPPELRGELDQYLHNYVERWLNPMMSRHDMWVVFVSTAEELRKSAPRTESEPTDAQIIDMFNIAILKVVQLACLDRKLRKAWNIKKGWLW